MKVFWIIIGILVVFTVLGIIDRIRKEKELLLKVKSSFGIRVGENPMPSERYVSLAAYLESLPKDDADIDAITWNDLDMDRIFMGLNHTCSAIGEEVLFAYLHKPCIDVSELERREQLIQLFSEDEELRVKTGRAFLGMGKLRAISVYDYMMRIHDIKRETNLRHYAVLAVYVAAVVLLFCGFVPLGVGLIFAAGLFNTATYLKRKGEIQPYLDAVSYISRWIKTLDKLSEDISKEKDTVIKDELKSVSGDIAIFRHFVRGSSLLAPVNPTGGGLMEMVLEYVRMLFHVDLIQFNRIYQIFEEHQTELHRLFTVTGRLDSMRAIASYRAYKKDYCIPVLHMEPLRSLKADAICHPLVDEPVANSISAERPVLLTGSNASGKSTFLKTLAVNAIFAQTIHTVLAKEYEADCFRILSSMALKDDLATKESYYIVEIRSLKRILDASEGSIPVLCFIDEVLRGTNTAERIAASSRILRYLAEQKALVFAATHDLELTTLLQDVYDNYHFSEQVHEDIVVFDYCLKPGRATSRNALKLLQMMEYPETITEKANVLVEEFLSTGEWKEQE